MYLQDISFSLVHIQPPKAIDEDKYVFGIHYENEYTKPIVFQSTHPYRMLVKKDECELHIKHKSDLRFFNELYKHLRNQLYEMHDQWFETKFERTKYDSIFNNYLFPNIEENAVNIKCSIVNGVEIGKTELICPTFELVSIVFDQSSFYITLNLTHIKPMKEEEAASHVAPPEVKCELQAEQDTLSNQFDTIDHKDPPSIESEKKEEIEEVQLKHNGDLEELSLQLNDEDYFLVFKIIQSNIKENFSKALIDTFQTKKIETKNINIQDIVYDSEEDSDDEYLNNDDFEQEYNNMVN